MGVVDGSAGSEAGLVLRRLVLLVDEDVFFRPPPGVEVGVGVTGRGAIGKQEEAQGAEEQTSGGAHGGGGAPLWSPDFGHGSADGARSNAVHSA